MTSAVQLEASRVLTDYQRRTPTSAKMARQAREVFPSGITHDGRYLNPYPLFVDRAEGSRKWDVDGNEYVDYFGGHGALLLGHNPPAIVEVVQRQLSRGSHYGANHRLELSWGELIKELVPCAERVRFTSSGTEATLLAMRLARAFTGRPKVLRFVTNFHGWQDHVAFGVTSHMDGSPSPGVTPGVAENILLCPPGDIDAVRRTLDEHDDIAAVMLEPTGASWGQVPLPDGFLSDLRELTAHRNVVLLFDEVISGFRCSPGGAQQAFNVTPDLTTLAKIVAGGFPGGAVVGRKEIMDCLDHIASQHLGREKVAHQGTFNANPISAAAGVAMLQIVRDTDACRRANEFGAQLRQALRREIHDLGLPWCVYGTFSGFHFYFNPPGETATVEEIESGRFDYRKIKASSSSPLAQKLRLGMLAFGVDLMSWPGGPTSAVHTQEDLERTVEALRQAIKLLREDGEV